MQVKSLRELASAYARGDIGRDDYRRSRSDLIAAVLRGEVQLKVNDYAPPISAPATDRQDDTTPRARTRPAHQAAPADTGNTAPAPAGDSASPRWFIPAGIAAVAVVGALLFIGRKPDAPVPPQATVAQAGPGTVEAAAAAPAAIEAAEEPVPEPAAIVSPEAEAGRALISAFLQDKDWSAERRETFLADWSELTPEEREAARASVEQGQLASAIYKKLLEERALSGLGDSDAAQARARELARFAEQVGLDDPRLKLPDNTGSDLGTAPPGLGEVEPLSAGHDLSRDRTSA